MSRRKARPRWWRQPLLGDAPEKSFPIDSSSCVSTVVRSGRRIASPARFENGTTTGFSHWDSVGPVLASGLASRTRSGNDRYAPLQLAAPPLGDPDFGLFYRTARLAWLWPAVRITSSHTPLARLVRITSFHTPQADLRCSWPFERPAAFVLGLPSLVLLGLGCLALLASTGFILTSLYAAVTGWALPTTALIRWSAMAQWAARNEPYTGHLLVALAASGALAAWLARLNPACQQAVERGEMRTEAISLPFWPRHRPLHVHLLHQRDVERTCAARRSGFRQYRRPDPVFGCCELSDRASRPGQGRRLEQLGAVASARHRLSLRSVCLCQPLPAVDADAAGRAGCGRALLRGPRRDPVARSSGPASPSSRWFISTLAVLPRRRSPNRSACSGRCWPSRFSSRPSSAGLQGLH